MKMVISHFDYWSMAKNQAQFTLASFNMQPPESKSPVLTWVPAMQRRRLSHYAKMALFVAQNSVNDSGLSSLPVIFASQHGDFHRTAKILKDLAMDQPLSPTSFGLSVHNAVVGLYSILTGNQQPMNSIAAGDNTLPMALVDAYGQLMSGAHQHVLVVYCDQPLPEHYQVFDDSTSCDLACAFVVSLSDANGINLEMTSGDGQTVSSGNSAVTFVSEVVNLKQQTHFTVSKMSPWQFTLTKGVA